MRTSTVLVADDMDFVRAFCRITLEASGYDVVLAANGTEAVELSQCRPGGFALSLIDSRMPGMEGVQVARGIRELYPGAAIVLMSGENTRSLLPPDLDDSCLVLDKPFTASQLRAVVLQAMEEKYPVAATPAFRIPESKAASS